MLSSEMRESFASRGCWHSFEFEDIGDIPNPIPECEMATALSSSKSLKALITISSVKTARIQVLQGAVTALMSRTFTFQARTPEAESTSKYLRILWGQLVCTIC